MPDQVGQGKTNRRNQRYDECCGCWCIGQQEQHDELWCVYGLVCAWSSCSRCEHRCKMVVSHKQQRWQSSTMTVGTVLWWNGKWKRVVGKLIQMAEHRLKFLCWQDQHQNGMSDTGQHFEGPSWVTQAGISPWALPVVQAWFGGPEVQVCTKSNGGWVAVLAELWGTTNWWTEAAYWGAAHFYL